MDELRGRGLIIHHWDADGICSARLLLERLGEGVDNITPRIGRYQLSETEIGEFSIYDFIVVADIALPERDILKLSGESEVIIFDHHLQPKIEIVQHHNPIASGDSPETYPSASWVVNEYLGNDVNIFALLGMVGDREERIKDNPIFWPIISDFCIVEDLEFRDMLQMVHLLDSSYKIGDKIAVEEAPRFLKEHGSHGDILGNNEWNQNLRRIAEEIQSQLDAPHEEIRGVVLKRMNTGFNIISTVTRRLAWERGHDVVVVNMGFFDDADQVYARSKRINMEPMIREGKTFGFKVGGKKDVLGAVVPKDKTHPFVKKIVEFMNKKINSPE